MARKNVLLVETRRKAIYYMAVHCHCRRLFRNIAEIFREIALLPRDEINRADRFHLPNNLKIEDIKRCEVTVPELVITFFENLGPDARRWESNFKKLTRKSMSEDAVFAATVGLKKLQKHLMLGITLKCLVGSRKVIEIMNRLGHCASYHTMEEVEIEGTFQSTKQNLVTPVGMKLNRC